MSTHIFWKFEVFLCVAETIVDSWLVSYCVVMSFQCMNYVMWWSRCGSVVVRERDCIGIRGVQFNSGTWNSFFLLTTLSMRDKKKLSVLRKVVTIVYQKKNPGRLKLLRRQVSHMAQKAVPSKTPGGALGYFLGGYLPPGTPNWHPVLKKEFP